MALTLTTTEQDVLDIMDNALAEADVTPYLTSATVFIESVFADTILTDSIVSEILRWMTAHMIALSKDRVSKEEGASNAYIKWAGEWGKSLNATQYGQMAMALDTTGVLTDLGKQKSSARIYAVPGN